MIKINIFGTDYDFNFSLDCGSYWVEADDMYLNGYSEDSYKEAFHRCCVNILLPRISEIYSENEMLINNEISKITEEEDDNK